MALVHQPLLRLVERSRDYSSQECQSLYLLLSHSGSVYLLQVQLEPEPDLRRQGMYKIDSALYGFKLTFGGFIQAAEMQ